MGTTDADGSDEGVDSRQVLLVSLCLFGLLTAAFLAPVTGANQPVGGGDGGLISDLLGDLLAFLFDDAEPEPPEAEPGDGGDGEAPPRWLIELLRELFDGGGGPSEGTPTGDCRVLVEGSPTPGTEATVLVTVGGEPEPDVRVWFNDRYVGRTGQDGTVSGEVPYVERLNVTVQTAAACTFERRPVVGAAGPALGGGDSAAAVSGPLARAAGVGPGSSPAGLAGDTVAQTSEDDAVNSSGEVQVDGRATVSIVGKPYPESTVTIVARAGRTPIPDANVTVDGERVGRTDDTGRYALRVPDRESIRLTVSRGAVSGTTRLAVWRLRIDIVPQVTVPGETVTANVSTAGGPVANAPVTLDGRRLDTSDDDGIVQFRAPATVTGSLTATTGRQTATVPAWNVYAVTGGLSLGLVVLSTLSTGAVARRYGRARARRVATYWAAVAVLFVGYAIWELPGILAGLLVVAAGWLLLNLALVRSGGATVADTVAGALERASRVALGIVGGLERLVDSALALGRRLLAWVRSLPRSLSGLAARLAAWLRTLPGRLRRLLGELPWWLVAAALAALALVAAATARFGLRGFVVSVVLVILAAVLLAVGRLLRSRETETEAETEPATATAGTDVPTGSLTLRELWRRLARRVLPETWRTRTPTEISQAAIDAGLPREPVELLTDVFRDVEYGGQSPTSRVDEAWLAYERLEDGFEEEDG